MIQGKTIQELAVEVSAQKERAQDFRVSQAVLEMDEQLHLRTIGGKTTTQLDIAPQQLMHGQMAEKLGVPVKYYNRMMAEAPELLRENVNHWLASGQDRRFIRTFREADGAASTGRAFLSNGYKPLDNYDLMTALVPPLTNTGLRAASSQVTETRLYMQLVTDKITAEVKRGDAVQLGLVVSNSEVGSGALSIQLLVYRLVCTNGLIMPAEDLPGFRAVHLGRGFEGDQSVLREETRRLTDAAIWNQARDVITAAVSQASLDNMVRKLQGIAQVRLQDPEKAVELVAKRYDLAEDERKGVMANLIAGADVSQWGLVNAVTSLANTAVNYDRAIELETIGGKVASIPANTFGLN
jgi:hypothetical protein